jgi:hypothetical protein
MMDLIGRAILITREGGILNGTTHPLALKAGFPEHPAAKNWTSGRSDVMAATGLIRMRWAPPERHGNLQRFRVPGPGVAYLELAAVPTRAQLDALAEFEAGRIQFEVFHPAHHGGAQGESGEVHDVADLADAVRAMLTRWGCA